MKQDTYELFKSADLTTIVTTIADELETRNEAPFWADKVVPFTEAILSVLIPLRDKNKLITPEGGVSSELTPELFLSWSDFVSLKSLAFKIQRLPELEIDLEILGKYLSRYNVNLENEHLDFPISHYNLHQGVSNVIKSLL